jgi:hypothetical protein
MKQIKGQCEKHGAMTIIINSLGQELTYDKHIKQTSIKKTQKYIEQTHRS